MKVIITGIISLSRETIRSLEDDNTMRIIYRGSVIDIEIDKDELAQEILQKHCGINLQ